jgi:hypothetical protein
MSGTSSRSRRLFWLLAAGAILARPAGSSPPVPTTTPGGAPHGTNDAALPAFFIANAGQADPHVLFESAGPGGSIFFLSSEIVVVTYADATSERKPKSASRFDVMAKRSAIDSGSISVRRLRFEGASPEVRLQGVRRLPGVANIFHGSDPSRWRTHLPIYAGIVYRNLYPGIDLELAPEGLEIRGILHVAPGADTSSVRGRWNDGSDGLPRLSEGISLASASRFEPATALAIGPSFYSTYYGGSGVDIAYALAVDADGAAYLTGSTLSSDLPTSGPIDGTCGTDGLCDAGIATDAFVAKFDPNQSGASSLIYATYLGGGGNDVGVGIAVDASKNAYVAGIARTGFPTTGNAYQQTFGSAAGIGADGFLSKLSPDGSSLLYSTYLGGSDGDGAWGVAADNSGNAWLTGETFSGNFPTTPGAYDTSCGSDGSCDATGDAYVARLDTTQSGPASLVLSTFLGGSAEDQGFGIALGAGNTIYLTGRTASTDFPHPGGYQASNGGGSYDAFFAKLAADGASLLYATYLGGEGYDDAYTVSVDGSGKAWLIGTTGSSTLLTTVNAFQGSFGGVFDAYFAQIDPAVAGAGSLLYSTYLGGSDDDEGYGLVRDGSGAAYLTGFTASTDFPVAGCPPRSASGGGYDAFLSRINPSLSGAASLVSSGYFGGAGTDAGYGLARDAAGNILFAGQTSSPDLPTSNAYVGSLAAGSTDAFLTRLPIRDCSAVSFFTVVPCRLLDTRNTAAPLTGPPLSGGTDRVFVLTGSCGIPSTAKAVSLNVTVTGPTAAGDLRLYPAETPRPLVSTINYQMAQTRANNAVAGLGAAGDLAVRCDQASGTVHLIIDVNGYFQ